MGNVRFPQYAKRSSKKELQERQILGFKTGVMCGAAVLNDAWDFTDEELREFVDLCNEVCVSIGKGDDDFEKINEALKEMTGIDIIFA